MALRDASDKIEAVLNEVMPELEDHDEGDILVEWVVVCYAANADPEKDSAYPMFFTNGDMPTYRARGLLQTGLAYLNDVS